MTSEEIVAKCAMLKKQYRRGLMTERDYHAKRNVLQRAIRLNLEKY